MKHLFLTILACCAISMAAQAQIFTAGIKAGVSSSSVDVENVKNNLTQFKESDNITGYHAGAFLRLAAGNLFVQPEGLFTYTGGKVEYSNDPNTTDLHVEKFKFTRLDVPLLLGYKVFNVVHVNAGPVASVLLNGKFEGDKIDQYMNNAEWGWQAGLGVDVGNLVADLRYQALNSGYEDAVNGNYDIKNGQIMLSLGLKIIGK
ncbi:porin family protein [Pontibacter liquoris]|uniref:porin family protein n=1 Tax=Pontibacter liquoris TaxID=2905677 RepID=UPI001FA6B15A|nr:porin family protein [Pontibacter liquoris]